MIACLGQLNALYQKLNVTIQIITSLYLKNMNKIGSVMSAYKLAK